MRDMRFGLLIVLCLALAGCSPSVDANNAADANGNDEDQTEAAAKPKQEDDAEGRVFNYFTLTDAEGLLQSKATLIDSATESNDTCWTFTSNFQSTDSSTTTSNRSLRLVFSHFPVPLAAHEAYVSSKKGAPHGISIRVLRDAGDEAYYYRDSRYVYGTVRKGSDLFTLRLCCNSDGKAEQRLYASLREVASRI